MKIKAAELLIKYLEEEGVEYVFGIPGGALQPIFNTLSSSEKITPVLTKHEEGAAFMAAGYAWVSGKLSVCCGTTGPGSTNLITGVASAYADSIPILVLTAQIATTNFGKGALQESTYEAVDTVDIYKSFTKYSAMVFKSSNLAEMVRRALRLALSGRRRPVHLNLPCDVMNEEVELDLRVPDTYRTWSKSFDRESVKKAATYLLKARNPAMILGSGAITSEATDEAKTIAEMLNIPVATTPKAKGAFPMDHELSLGVFGVAGSPMAERYILADEVDILLTVGTSFNEWATKAWDPRFLPKEALLQIDIDPYEIGKNYPVTVRLVGDAKTILTEVYYEMKRQIGKMPDFKPNVSLSEFLKFKESSKMYIDEEKMSSDAIPIKPQRLMKDLRDSLSYDAIIFVDAGSTRFWAIHYLPVYYPKTFITGIGFASMGYGVAAAVGGKFAAPDKPVVSIVGDGSFLMNGMEVATAVNYNMPVIWVILNDAQLGMVYHGQKALGHHVVACTFQRVDFVKIAEGLGAQGIRIDKPGQINRDMMDEIIESGKPTVLDVIIDSEESPPIGSRISALKRAYDD